MVLTIDARTMQPPEPLERVMEALDTLDADDEIELVAWREPVPLYRILARNGYRYDTRTDPDGTVRVRIRVRGDIPAGGADRR
ncbi:MAG: DUF2249 domain-containing protein [Gammaproteobacteria bacterium]